MPTSAALPEALSRTGQPAPRSIVFAMNDPSDTASLRASLAGMRWQVREVRGAAEAIAELERQLPEALVLDRWLPDIEVNEFATWVNGTFPHVDILRNDGHVFTTATRNPRRSELMIAFHGVLNAPGRQTVGAVTQAPLSQTTAVAGRDNDAAALTAASDASARRIPGLVGDSEAMQEMCQLIRLVAPRDTTVLIEGPTGSGKELVAQALHLLSRRASRSFAVLNSAAIPEALLEAELFGHTRGAFTGATQSRIGRIEAADGGTLFLDEIGEMPLALQAKMLRFLECGEIQRVGDNSITHVNVRVLAATHQPLEQRAAEGNFRLDLYHRLAVFLLEIPALRNRMEDLPMLAEHFLDQFGLASGRRHLTVDALEVLRSHDWPGNVRELRHVMERATILCGSSPTIEGRHIRLRRRP